MGQSCIADMAGEGAHFSRLSLIKSGFFFKLGRGLYSALDLWLAAALLALITLHFLSQPLPIPALIHPSDFLDLSQNLDIIAKSQQGVWLGRDVIFTYGPVFQWLLSRLPAAAGISLGSYYRSFWVFQFWAIILPTYGFSALLLLRRQQPWKRAFCLLVLVIFWAPNFWSLFDIKMLLPLFCFAVFCRFCEELQNGPRLSVKAAAAASLMAISFLVAADTGIYTAAAFAIVAISFLLFHWREKAAREALLRLSLAVAGIFALWVLLINFLTGDLFDFHFWRGNFEVVAQYRWSESLAMMPGTAAAFWGVLLACSSVFVYSWWRLRRSGQGPDQRGIWVAVVLFSLLPLQASIVSSERFHLALGLFPMIAIAVVMLLGAGEAGRQSRVSESAGIAAVVILTAIFSGPNHLFAAENLGSLFVARGTTACPPGLEALDQACLAEPEFSLLKSVSDYVQANSAPSDPILVFPHQNIFGFLAHRRVSGKVLQNYLAAGDYLTAQQLSSFDHDRPPLAVYVVVRGGLDGIEYFQRLPQIWFYLQKWYEVQARPQESVFVLRRNPERASAVEFREYPIVPTVARRSIADGQHIDVATFSETGAAQLDFVKMRLKLKYPFWWKLLKPAVIALKLRFDDDSELTKLVLVPPNQEYDVWVYPWEPERLVNYFAPDPANWRAGPPRRELKKVAIEFVKADWASVLPSEILVSKVSGVSLSTSTAEKKW